MIAFDIIFYYDKSKQADRPHVHRYLAIEPYSQYKTIYLGCPGNQLKLGVDKKEQMHIYSHIRSNW